MTRFCDVTHNYKMFKMEFEPSHPQQQFALTIPPPMATNNIITKIHENLESLITISHHVRLISLHNSQLNYCDERN